MATSRSALVLSIQPRYAKKIFSGDKTVELRRVRPRLSQGITLLIYVSSPVKALNGIGTVARVTSGEPSVLWDEVGDETAISRTEYDVYFSDAEIGFAIHLQEVRRFTEPIPLRTLRELWPEFHPPQCYRYFTPEELLAFRQLLCESATELRPLVRSKASC